MKQLKYLLNLPWTLLGVVFAITAMPYGVTVKNQAIIFYCLTCGVVYLYAPKAKGFTLGNLVVIRKGMANDILEHELVNVEQYMRKPFVHYFLSLYETIRYGYWNNRYEVEAYNRTNTWPENRKH